MRSLSSKASGCIFPRNLLATPSVSPQVQKNQDYTSSLITSLEENVQGGDYLYFDDGRSQESGIYRNCYANVSLVTEQGIYATTFH
jgi:hypothetical protein